MGYYLPWETLTIGNRTNKETIEYLYHKEKLGVRRIAKRLGVSVGAMYARMRDLGIVVRNHEISKVHRYLSETYRKTTLAEMKKRVRLTELADRIGVSPYLVRKGIETW